MKVDYIFCAEDEVQDKTNKRVLELQSAGEDHKILGVTTSIAAYTMLGVEIHCCVTICYED